MKYSLDKQGEPDFLSGSMNIIDSKSKTLPTIKDQQNEIPDNNASIKTPNSDQVINVDGSENPGSDTEEAITEHSNQDSRKHIVKEDDDNNNTSSDVFLNAESTEDNVFLSLTL